MEGHTDFELDEKQKKHAAYMADLYYFQSQLENTKNVNLYFPIASIAVHLNKYDEAISVAQEGLEAIPSYTQLQVLLADAFYNMGRRDEAKELLHDAIISDSSNYKALRLLGMIYRTEDFYTEALRYLRMAYLLAPEDQEIYGWLEELGGLPISGTSDQLDSREEEFGDFDNDLVFDFNVDKTIDESKAAMAAMLEEITGKSSSSPAGEGAAEEAAPAAPVTDTETATTAGADADDILAGNAISDDEIMNALNKAAAPNMPAELAPDAVQLDEANVNDMVAAISDLPTIEDGEDATIDAPEAPPIMLEPPVMPSEPTIGTEELPEPPMIAAVEPMMIEELTPVPPMPEPTEPEQAEQAEDSLDAELPDLSGLDEVLPDPIEPAMNMDIPELAELPDPNLDIDIDEDELQRALDAFSQLPVEAAPEPEEDTRLEPIIPKGLVSEVLQESGLDLENPYDDDEPIENLMHELEAAKPAQDKPESTLEEIVPELDETEEEPTITELEGFAADEAMPVELDELPNIDELLPALDEIAPELDEAEEESTITEFEGFAADEAMPVELDELPSIDELLPALDEIVPEAKEELMMPIELELDGLAPLAIDSTDIMDDETANLWELDENMEPEMVRLWADALDEDREELEDEEKIEKDEPL
jgi:tetratricopeptide (TPR) repeat protein